MVADNHTAPLVVITDAAYRSYDIERDLVASVNGTLEFRQCHTEADVISLAANADGAIVRLQPVTRAVIERLQRCRVIARYGTGVDNVDLDAATERGIVVANVVHYAVDEVAEHAAALLLSCARKVTSHDRRIRAGDWDIGQRDPLHTMNGSVLGVIGLGEIGRALIRKLGGMGLRVLACDPYASAALARSVGAELTGMEAILREADYLSLHAPLTEETRHLIDRDALAKMKRRAILVNTSRGGLVDTAALCHALAEGWIDGAGLDVHEEEPLPRDHPLFALDNVILLDHAGWYSEESFVRLQTGAAEAVVAVLMGRRPRSIVNPDVLTHPLARGLI